MRILASIVIVIYLFALSRPIQTMVNFVQNQDQIAEELCENKDIEESTCNGKCYLMKELANEVEVKDQDTQEKDNSKKQKSNQKVKDYERLVEGPAVPFVSRQENENKFFHYRSFSSTYAAEILIPPPQFLYI